MQETKLKLLERIVDRRQDSLYRFAYIRTGSQAEVIRLKTSDSLTFARIAEITGTTEATVKSRFRYGIGKLRKLINH